MTAPKAVTLAYELAAALYEALSGRTRELEPWEYQAWTQLHFALEKVAGLRSCERCGRTRTDLQHECPAPALASGALVTDSSPARLSVHVYQDRIEGEGFVVAGLTVEHYAGQPVTVLRWEGRDPDMDPDLPSFSLTFAQAEQLRDALTEVLAREPAKQDPVADAEEDEIYRTAVTAVGRMEAAEAREDAADGRKK